MRFKLHPDVAITCHLVGEEKTPLLVIDNFLADPNSLIEYCVHHMKFSKVDNFYPGIRMDGPDEYLRDVIYYLEDVLKKVFSISLDNIAGGKSLYSMVITPPEELEKKQCLPHIDSYLSGDLACVHYLCGPEQGGTSLYRHRKTGYERITSDIIETYTSTVLAEGALAFERNAYMNGSNQYYERIASVDAAFNRMVIYPSNILHSGNISEDFKFDTHPEKGRLTLNSFIYTKRK